MVPAVGRAGRIVRSGRRTRTGSAGRRTRSGSHWPPTSLRDGVRSAPIGSRRASTHPRSSARWSTGCTAPSTPTCRTGPPTAGDSWTSSPNGVWSRFLRPATPTAYIHVGPNRCHRSAQRSTAVHSMCATLRCAPWWRADRDHVHHAALLDPNTSTALPPDRIAAMVDELLDAHQATGTLPETLHR